GEGWTGIDVVRDRLLVRPRQVLGEEVFASVILWRIVDAVSTSNDCFRVKKVVESKARRKIILACLNQCIRVSGNSGYKNISACEIVVRHLILRFGIWVLVLVPDTIVQGQLVAHAEGILRVPIQIPALRMWVRQLKAAIHIQRKAQEQIGDVGSTIPEECAGDVGPIVWVVRHRKPIAAVILISGREEAEQRVRVQLPEYGAKLEIVAANLAHSNVVVDLPVLVIDVERLIRRPSRQVP